MEREALLQSIRSKTEGIIDPEHVISVAAQPRPQIVVELDDEGREQENRRHRDTDIAVLRLLLWEILESEGKTLALIALSSADAVSPALSRSIGPGWLLGVFFVFLEPDTEKTPFNFYYFTLLLAHAQDASMSRPSY